MPTHPSPSSSFPSLTTLLEGEDPSDWLFVTTVPTTLVKPTNDLPLGEDVPVDLEKPLVDLHHQNLQEGIRGSKLEEMFLEGDTELFSQLKDCHGIEEEKKLIRKALLQKAKATGISLRILRLVFNRGKRAWAKVPTWNSAPSVQWGLARVNSFCCGGRFRQADKDLWEKHKVLLSSQETT